MYVCRRVAPAVSTSSLGDVSPVNSPRCAGNKSVANLKQFLLGDPWQVA
jgi:hypothetical protein